MLESHRPAVLAVDDDPHVLRAIRRDLSRAYQDRYRVVACTSPEEALSILDSLQARNEEPALLMADQRMPHMSGIDFLGRSAEKFPSARRVLLTAYADTSVAISAINDVGLDHYLVKPWEPPEERLYPVLDDLLAEWSASYQPPYGGIRVIGYRFAPATHRVRDCLTRLHQPFRFTDVERDDAGAAVTDAAVTDAAVTDAGALPIVRLPDGVELNNPSYADLVRVLQLDQEPSLPHYDLAIVGGGPTGLAASVYSASEGLSTLLLDSYVPGGQAGTSSRIENYLGFPAGVAGSELTRRAVAQARRFGVKVLSPAEANGLRRAGRAHVLTTSDGRDISAANVLLATGLSYHRLDADGSERFEGAGIYYGATESETASCVNQHVWIVGGANSAGQAALHFAAHASQVTMLVRASDLAKGMSQYLVEEIQRTANINVLLNSVVQAVHGDERLEAITVHDRSSGETTTADAEVLFTFIGARPRTDWLNGVVCRDANGFVLTGSDLTPDASTGWDLPRGPLPLETSVPGVFAAGDVRANSMKRIASGVGEGAMAVALVHRYRSET